MLYQLHWQNRRDNEQTEFVAQADLNSPEEFQSWINDVIDRRGNEIPEGWCPVVMTSDCHLFVWAKGQQDATTASKE